MRHIIIHHCKRLFLYERSPQKLALAASIAVYVALSPFLGLHTIMNVVAGWVLGLNIPVILLISYLLNNPWTMVPIMLAGYWVGYTLLHTLLGYSVAALNPQIMDFFNYYIHKLLGITDVSFWAFMLGGNILGIVVAVVQYPFMLALFKELAKEETHDQEKR